MGKTILKALGITVALVVCLVAVAEIHSMYLWRHRGRGANESSAIAAIRTISSAQETFRSALVLDQDEDGHGEYGTLEQMAGIDPNLPVDPPFLDEQLGMGNKSGYIFDVYLGEAACEDLTGIDAQEKDYYATAIPLAYGRSGNRSFCIDASGVIRGSDVGGREAVCSDITSTASPWPVIGG